MVVVEVNGYKIKPGADLERAKLEGADLSGADLARANLFGAKLEGADLSGADLARAKADKNPKNTTWPEGFDPVAAGVIFE